MKSTIKIALGEQNEPVIKMMAVTTEDIRDQLCGQWVQILGGESNLAFIEFGPQGSLAPEGEQFCHVSIRPLPAQAPMLILEQVRGIETTLREQRNRAWTSMLVGGDVIYWENNNHLGEVNAKTAISPQLNRREIEKLSTNELVKKVTAIFDNIDNWKVIE